jgi:hypothetical protein
MCASSLTRPRLSDLIRDAMLGGVHCHDCGRHSSRETTCVDRYFLDEDL